ncbi:L,D-transpeptidase family protein [Thalassovita sp.]|jgi:L,D-peptidoglycan transpeptidase YkuD (ErfK/YbiS/YcfS/YnhG family)|uniref:L,D-transpeptidase family protein n=1 Tax=Thalassovita sp. TaxID=1979401 RepID=UPI003B590224
MNACDLVLTPTHLRFMNRRFACTIGRGGLTGNKQEGDGATPRGVHRILEAYFRADRMAQPVPWARPIGPQDLWSDASGEADYNSRVRAPYASSHEQMRRADPMYDLILVTDWNYPKAESGKGSAIFIHQWRRPGWPTAGCVAFSRTDLRFIAQHLSPRSRLIIR